MQLQEWMRQIIFHITISKPTDILCIFSIWFLIGNLRHLTHKQTHKHTHLSMKLFLLLFFFVSISLSSLTLMHKQQKFKTESESQPMKIIKYISKHISLQYIAKWQNDNGLKKSNNNHLLHVFHWVLLWALSADHFLLQVGYRLETTETKCTTFVPDQIFFASLWECRARMSTDIRKRKKKIKVRVKQKGLIQKVEKILFSCCYFEQKQ